MAKRVVVAIPIAVIVLLAVFVQGIALGIIVAALSLIAAHEMARSMGNVVKGVYYCFAVLLAALYLLSYMDVLWLFDPLFIGVVYIAFVMAAFAVSMFSNKYDMDSLKNTVFAFIYPQAFFVLFYYLTMLQAGAYMNMMMLMLMVFLPAMLSDTVAYFIGSAFGKTKLCPKISPKKTVAGSVGGIVGGAIGAAVSYLVVFIYANYVQADMTRFSLPLILAAGAILAAAGQIGDLAASFIKRSLNIKDFGKLLPGHGGILDRFDSILFCVPVVFIIAYLLMA